MSIGSVGGDLAESSTRMRTKVKEYSFEWSGNIGGAAVVVNLEKAQRANCVKLRPRNLVISPPPRTALPPFRGINSNFRSQIMPTHFTSGATRLTTSNPIRLVCGLVVLFLMTSAAIAQPAAGTVKRLTIKSVSARGRQNRFSAYSRRL